MDIQKIISDVLSQLEGNDNLIAKTLFQIITSCIMRPNPIAVFWQQFMDKRNIEIRRHH